MVRKVRTGSSSHSIGQSVFQLPPSNKAAYLTQEKLNDLGKGGMAIASIPRESGENHSHSTQ